MSASTPDTVAATGSDNFPILKKKKVSNCPAGWYLERRAEGAGKPGEMGVLCCAPPSAAGSAREMVAQSEIATAALHLSVSRETSHCKQQQQQQCHIMS